jgi:uncharacterized membrane protein YoaK (UPF0700 family)
MSLNGGFVDTAGFLALHGLFTAHVTGNFVTLGAALVQGTSGTLTKLLALPVFCVVVVLARWSSYRLPAVGLSVLRTMLASKMLLLVVAAALAVRYGPFSDGDSGFAMLTGMALVSAMAVQNAAHRVHLASAPPSTLMTGTTTQIMLDLTDLLRGMPSPDAGVARTRLLRMLATVAVFAAGCAAAALSYMWVNVWCFVIPPVLAACTLIAQYLSREGEATAAAGAGASGH